MYKYAVMFYCGIACHSIEVGQVKAETDRKALNLARKIWGKGVTVSRY